LGGVRLTIYAIVSVSAVALSLLAPLGSAAAGASGPVAQVSPATLSFGEIPVGTRSDARAVTVTNTGDAPLTISTFRINGPDAADFGQGAACPVAPDTLAPGASCTIYVSFSPDSPGPKSATLAIGDDAPSSPQTVALSGTGLDVGGGTPAATVTPAALPFGNQVVYTRSNARAVTLANTGTAPLAISTFRILGTDAVDFAQGADCPISPATLPVGASCTIYVSFMPDSEGPKSATLSIGDDAPDSPQAVSLSGTGTLGSAEVTLSPTALTFADRAVGTTSDAQAVTLTNTGLGPLTISTFRINGTDAADFAQGANCPVGPDTLAAGASCTIYVSFTPHSAGPKSATLAIGDDAPSSPQTVALSGRGLADPDASLSPSALSFGSQTVGTSSVQIVSLVNTGGGPLEISNIGITGSGAVDFAETNNCPASLAAGASCSVSVTFDPPTAGMDSASLTLTDNAGTGSQAVPLSGTGLPPGTYFSEDFESGSLVQWNTLTSSDSAINLDSTVAHSGTTSVRLTNASGGQSSRLYADLAGGGHSQSYTRFCFRIAPGLTEGIEIANGRAITAEYPLGIRRWEITYNPVTRGLEGYFFNEALDRLELYAANGLVLPGEWHCAELYFDESVNGQARLSLDGTLVGSVSGDLGTPNPYSRVYLWNQPSAGTVWFDDVRVADTPSG
jgi:hypothetical protein